MFNGFYSGKRILITGNTGFKGSWLSIWLTKLGADVIGFALPPPTDPSLFKICNLEAKTTYVAGDVTKFEELSGVLKKFQPEIVFHLAAQSLVRYAYKEPLETYRTNVMGTANLLEACRQLSSVRAIVNVTSDKCYENREWVWGYRENDPMGGYDPYSSSKGCAELVTTAYTKSFFNPEDYENHGVAVASVRAGNVIGGGDWATDRLIPDCIKALQKNNPVIIRHPEAIRPWQHVLEPLYGYLLLTIKLHQGSLKFSGGWNFGQSDFDVKPVNWIVERIIGLWGEKASWKVDTEKQPHEANYLKLDCSKAKSKLGWSPQWNLDQALEKTISWYQAQLNRQNMYQITLDQIQAYEQSIKQHE